MRFPRNVLTVSERQDIKPNTSIGSWVNGVSIWSYKSSEYVQFGPLTNITVDGGGEGYDAGAKPNLLKLLVVAAQEQQVVLLLTVVSHLSMLLKVVVDIPIHL